jgi:hypothetical protein
MSSQLQLYFRRNQHGFVNASVGRFIIHEIEADASQRGLSLKVEFLPDANASSPQAPTYWVRLEATIRTQLSPAQIVGSVRIDQPNQPPFPPTPPNRTTSVAWLWHLLPQDVELIEQSHSLQPAAPIYVDLSVEGIAQTAEGVFGVEGHEQVKIELSQWRRLLGEIGYSIAPSGLAALSAAALTDNSWREAAKRLEPARDALARGETHAALETCLSQLESLETAPYKVETWKARFAAMPDQKRDSLAAWAAGLGTYLNRVGHHRSREQRDQEGDLTSMPLDQWEAELTVASTQIVLAYLLRLAAAVQ